MHGAYPRREEQAELAFDAVERQPEYSDVLYDFGTLRTLSDKNEYSNTDEVTITVMGDPAKKAGIALSLLRYYLGITQ